MVLGFGTCKQEAVWLEVGVRTVRG